DFGLTFTGPCWLNRRYLDGGHRPGLELMRPFSANFVVRLLLPLLLFSVLLAARGAMASVIIIGPPEPDTQPPTLGITSPAEGAVFENGSVTVQGWASDDPGVSALVSGLDRILIRVDTLYAAGEYQTIME